MLHFDNQRTVPNTKGGSPMPQNKDHNGIPQLDRNYDPDSIDKRPSTFEAMAKQTQDRLDAFETDQATQHTPNTKNNDQEPTSKRPPRTYRQKDSHE